MALGGHGLLLNRRLWTGVAVVLLAAPLSLMRRITALKYSASFALTCVLLITIMVFLFAVDPPGAPALNPCSGSDECRTTPVLATDAQSTLRALPIFIFSYTCHQNIVSISNELATPTSSRMLRVIVAAIGMTLAVYVVLSYAGYSTFGEPQPLVSHRLLTAWATVCAPLSLPAESAC